MFKISVLLLIGATTAAPWSSAHAQPVIQQKFIQETVPKKYPQLLAFVRSQGPQRVTWTTESGETQSLNVQLSKNGHLVMDTWIFAGAANVASTTKEKTDIVMIDRTLQGRIEHLAATPNGGKRQVFERPADEGSTFLWYSSLAIIFRQTKCCPG